MISIIVLLIIIAILAFTFVVFIHELGHFLTAKWCGIRVNEFAIGMG
ncbi:MAG: site-2 protease family protein, partial [Acutalibacteraceae bacterium]